MRPVYRSQDEKLERFGCKSAENGRGRRVYAGYDLRRRGYW
jgi:hypothetical protein